MSIRLTTFFFIATLLICACKSPQNVVSETSTAPVKQIESTVPMPYGQENFRLEATVVAIDPTRTNDSGSVCSKAPCFAYFKIESVEEGGPMDWKGGICKARFAYSLADSWKVLPELKHRYPGLKVEDRFSAKVKIENMGTEQWKLVVYHYDLLPRP